MLMKLLQLLVFRYLQFSLKTKLSRIVSRARLKVQLTLVNLSMKSSYIRSKKLLRIMKLDLFRHSSKHYLIMQTAVVTPGQHQVTMAVNLSYSTRQDVGSMNSLERICSCLTALALMQVWVIYFSMKVLHWMQNVMQQKYLMQTKLISY